MQLFSRCEVIYNKYLQENSENYINLTIPNFDSILEQPNVSKNVFDEVIKRVCERMEPVVEGFIGSEGFKGLEEELEVMNVRLGVEGLGVKVKEELQGGGKIGAC